MRVGHTGMKPQHILENILAVSEMLSEKLPEVQYGECLSRYVEGSSSVCVDNIISLFQKWQSVKLLFLKTEKSVSLPIFSSFVTCQDENNIMPFNSLRKKVSIS